MSRFKYTPQSSGSNKQNGKSDQVVIEASAEIVSHFFQEKGKKVLTFVGYSGSGYEKENEFISKANEILSLFNPDDTIVNIGASYYGIGIVYREAKKLGFETTGIISSLSNRNQNSYSRFCDYVFIIKDKTYGGFIDKNKETLSPTSEIMVNSSNILVALGGGTISHDEFLMAKKRGKKVAFYQFDSNHSKVSKKSSYHGNPPPTDFSSPVAQVADENDVL